MLISLLATSDLARRVADRSLEAESFTLSRLQEASPHRRLTPPRAPSVRNRGRTGDRSRFLQPPLGRAESPAVRAFPKARLGSTLAYRLGGPRPHAPQ